MVAKKKSKFDNKFKSTTPADSRIWWFDIVSLILSQNMRRFMSYFVVHRIIRPLYIYTKETIGQTSIRDIQDLVGKNILVEDIPGAKRPSYSIVFDAEDLTQFFTDVRITQEYGIPYLNKYCSYLMASD